MLKLHVFREHEIQIAYFSIRVTYNHKLKLLPTWMMKQGRWMRWSSFLPLNFCLSHELLLLKFRLQNYILEFHYILVITVIRIGYIVVGVITGFGARGDFRGHLFQIMMLKRQQCWPRLILKTRQVGYLDMSPEMIKHNEIVVYNE